MAIKIPSTVLAADKVDITPMIDVVFLLLVYFLWTTDLTQEADLGITLPYIDQSPPPDIPPSDHIVDIEADGNILFNGALIDTIDSRDMPQLTERLAKLKAINDPTGVLTTVTIIAHPASLHQRSIDVLNACADAGVTVVSFAKS